MLVLFDLFNNTFQLPVISKDETYCLLSDSHVMSFDMSTTRTIYSANGIDENLHWQCLCDLK